MAFSVHTGPHVQPRDCRIRNPVSEDIAPAFDVLEGPLDALYVVGDPLAVTNRMRLNILALAARLPTMYIAKEHVETGGLISYGPNIPDLLLTPP